MKLLRLVYEWPEPWDGLTPGPYEITRAQQKLGHDITVFCGGGFKELGKVGEPGNSPKPGFGTGLKAWLLSLPGSLQVFRFPRALRGLSLFLTTAPCVLLGYLWLKITGRGPDLVHGHGHITACFNIYKALFGWLDKTPYVLHLHVTAAGREAELGLGNSGGGEFPKAKLWDPASPEPCASPKLRQRRGFAEASRTLKLSFFPSPPLDFWTHHWEWPIHKFSDWLGVRVADKIICSSTRVRDEAIKYYGADPDKLVVVENGVNTVLFSSRKKFQAQSADRRTEFQILYVGALQPRKNVHLLVEALSHLAENYSLTLVGQGSEEYERRLRDLAIQLDIEDRVEFRGYIKYPKLPESYQTASVFVLPSSYEGLPKVVLEALASGVPVLASGFELGEDIQGLEFLESLDPEQIGSSIKKIVEKGEGVAVETVREKYSWEVQADKIEQVYQSLNIKSSTV